MQINNVRIIYPVLTPEQAEAHYARSSFQNDGGAKMSAKFLLDPKANAAGIKQLKARMEELFKEEKWAAGVKGLSHVALNEGENLPNKEGEIPDHYVGMYVLNTKAYLEQPVNFVGVDGKPVAYEDVKDSFYSGALCNIQVNLTMSKKYKVVSCVLKGIQPLPGGERLNLGGSSPEKVAAAFDDVGDVWAAAGDANADAA